MSFSYSVKKELCGLMTDRDRKFACLYGMLLFCKNFDAEGTGDCERFIRTLFKRRKIL